MLCKKFSQMIPPEQDAIEIIWSAMRKTASNHPRFDSRIERIFLCRFGSDEDSDVLTLQKLSDEYSISRERIRQLLKRAERIVVQEARLHNSILGSALVAALGDADKIGEAEGIKRLVQLIVNARCPKPFRELALSCAFARFGWVSKKKGLLTDLDLLLKNREQEERLHKKLEREESTAKTKDNYLLRVFRRAEFPQDFLLDQPALATTKRVRQARNYPSYFSNKLSRLVALDSSSEKQFLQAVDRSGIIVDFVEQPFEIPYTMHGKTRFYTPDFLVRTVENIQIVVEIKSPLLIADETVQAKALAAQSFLQERGIAYVLCDSSGITPAEMKAMNVGEDMKRLLRKILRKNGLVTFDSLVQIGGRLPSLSEIRGIQALSLQYPSLLYQADISDPTGTKNLWSRFDFTLELRQTHNFGAFGQ